MQIHDGYVIVVVQCFSTQTFSMQGITMEIVIFYNVGRIAEIQIQTLIKFVNFQPAAVIGRRKIVSTTWSYNIKMNPFSLFFFFFEEGFGQSDNRSLGEHGSNNRINPKQRRRFFCFSPHNPQLRSFSITFPAGRQGIHKCLYNKFTLYCWSPVKIE